MAILTLTLEENWIINPSLVPRAFWSYTSIVTKVVLSGAHRVKDLHEDLLKRFQQSGIAAHMDNKTVFELINREDRKTWYFGFKDGQFNIGLGVLADSWLKPVT